MRRSSVERNKVQEVLCPEVAIAPRSTEQWDSFRVAYRRWIAALDRFHLQIEIAAARRDADIQHIQAAWDDASRTFKSVSENTRAARRLRVGLPKKRRR